MGFDIAIHSPAAILIVAGILFLAFNDYTTGWVLVVLGALLAFFITYVRPGHSK